MTTAKQDDGGYDPIADEFKELMLEEWRDLLIAEVTKYSEEFKETNEYSKGKHTFDEWMGTFTRYMSW